MGLRFWGLRFVFDSVDFVWCWFGFCVCLVAGIWFGCLLSGDDVVGLFCVLLVDLVYSVAWCLFGVISC